MNGAASGVNHGNGATLLNAMTATSEQDIHGDTSLQVQIQEALTVVHGPYSSHGSRQRATDFLESIKATADAPYQGFILARHANQRPEVRHFALSLIQHAIVYKWDQYTQAEKGAVRSWVIELAREISEKDPSFVQNKIAQLWVFITWKSWGSEWMDMDHLLNMLWSYAPDGGADLGIGVHREFVLFILQTLSDETTVKGDEPMTRQERLVKDGCAEIFMSASTLAEERPDKHRHALRYGDSGWLMQLSQHLSHLLDRSPSETGSRVELVITKILSVFATALPWVNLKAVMNSNCVEAIMKGLSKSVISIQVAAIEALHSLYERDFSSEEFTSLVCPMYRQQVVTLLQQMYEWSIVDPQNIDEEKYKFSKKLSEMMAQVGKHIEVHTSSLPNDFDLAGLFNLYLQIARSESFFVSITALLTWGHLLRSDDIAKSPLLDPFVPALLKITMSRLIRFDNIPDETEDPILILLLEDVDTFPERHAFLGNYRRYCTQIIETVVKQRQTVGLYYVLEQVDNTLSHVYDNQPPFSMEKYTKLTVSYLQADAQFTIVHAALQGYMRWLRKDYGKEPEADVQTRSAMEDAFEKWCEQLLKLNFQDPSIRQKGIQLAVMLSTSALPNKDLLPLKLLEHIFQTQPADHPEHQAYSEAVKELQSTMMHDLLRLAIKFPDQFLDVYSEIEAKVQQIVSTNDYNPKRKTSFQTFLFTIIHRNTKLDTEVRLRLLSSWIKPVEELWQTTELNQALSDFPSFCGLLGLDRIKDYLVTRRVHEIEEWNLYQLDAEGQAIQDELDTRAKALPLRTTKAFLSCSADKIDRDTPEYAILREMWRDSLPVILPNLLKFIAHAHAFHNPANWTGLPPEMGSIVNRILSDRFWQAGISAGSKDEFLARVTGTRSTLEGLASSIRGTVRGVREACYSLLYSVMHLDTDFYGFNELPGPLAHALFADAQYLSSHQLIALVNVVRFLITECPTVLRGWFTPPLIITCVTEMDAKCVRGWGMLSQRQTGQVEAEDLTVEMKEESILRQLTYAIVHMIADFLDPARPVAENESDGTDEHPDSPETHWTLRKLCLSSADILGPLLLCLVHVLRMRDTRCSTIAVRVLRNVIPELYDSKLNMITSIDEALRLDSFTASTREFICSDVLKAAITSLNEPYFVDIHKDLTLLIATIISTFARQTATPIDVLLSLPGMPAHAVHACVLELQKPKLESRREQDKRQINSVLTLLSKFRGVSISEQGRIKRPSNRKPRSKMQQEFIKAPPPTPQADDGPQKRGGSVDLEGVADMFGGERRV